MLTVWRVTHLLQAEHGPSDVMVRLRRAVEPLLEKVIELLLLPELMRGGSVGISAWQKLAGTRFVMAIAFGGCDGTGGHTGSAIRR